MKRPISGFIQQPVEHYPPSLCISTPYLPPRLKRAGNYVILLLKGDCNDVEI
jgi:hypothetical protein